MKYLIALLFVPMISIGTPMEDAINAAKYFCKEDKECIDILAIELDSSYYEGTKDSKNKNKYAALKRKESSLEDLCEKAPDSGICETYKLALMERYIAGITR